MIDISYDMIDIPMLDEANKMHFCCYLRIKQRLQSTALEMMFFTL